MSTYRLNDDGEILSFTPPTGDINGLKLHGSYLYFRSNNGLSPDEGMTYWKYGRLDAETGALDQTWSPADTGDYNIYGIDVDASGNVVLGISAYVYPLTYQPVIKLLSDGTSDPSFACAEFTSAAPSAEAYSVLFQDDGKIVVGGQFNGLSGYPDRYCICRLNTNGTIDDSLGALAADEIGTVSVLTKGNGFVWAGCQSFYNSGFVEQARVFKINPSGSFDNTFDLNLYASFDTPRVSALEVDSTGRLYVGGLFYDTSAGTASYILRLNSDGTLDSSFLPALNGVPVGIKVRADGNILVGGTFNTVNGQDRQGQVLLDVNGEVL